MTRNRKQSRLTAPLGLASFADLPLAQGKFVPSATMRDEQKRRRELLQHQLERGCIIVEGEDTDKVVVLKTSKVRNNAS